MTQEETTVAGIDITPKQDGGVIKEILRPATSEEQPTNGDTVIVHYVGTLLDGSEFDSSRSRGEKFSFALGEEKVIKAWDIGVATMKKGELSRFTCKSDYAYGKRGFHDKIGPDATLVFEIELFDWKEDLSPKKDDSIIRRMISKGEGTDTPNDGATVNVHYIGYYEDKQFEDRDVTFVIGEGSAEDVIEGLDIVVKHFKFNEHSTIEIDAKYAYGEEGNAKFNIPPNARLKYDVTLKSFEKAKEIWRMDAKEKLRQAELAKNKGTQYYKSEKYQIAVRQYKKIVSYLENESSLEDDEEVQKKSLLLAAHLNTALCHLKTNDSHHAIQACDKALEIDEQNVKGLFRRGQAKMNENDYKEALGDFNSLLKLEPDNKAAKNHIIICTKKMKDYKEKEKKLYANIFSKYTMENAKLESNCDDEGNVFDNVGEWNNDMAKGMMSIPQEMEAFGEKMPETGTACQSHEDSDDNE
ncbi:peptidyl-prolyl cis-trans isomerase FKBP4 isoform X1 [Octopus bimaculoides]|uniref:peptidyl-prolyl cis-trans isomerase FKBP4 isoform X1 n=1 Tax=Octopus bimaculoides TaxID=37653 RepID=UPI00071C5EF5|nr:peptidyl-prolyl cis-trans isomerase FKBP4 isoform X1 [Octopus bimaculoides]|eukprot:XP_014791337.1 PREDICTED: peptidyl-prolyl cis-trans isomerase FKBP4-like isoform X1 [Octopus bimaculoides]